MSGQVGSDADIYRAAANAHGLGMLVRGLVGMDRAAAKQALGRFASDKALNANQLEFVSLIVDHLSSMG